MDVEGKPLNQRRALQSLCKEAGLKANGKTVDLVNRLAQHEAIPSTPKKPYKRRVSFSPHHTIRIIENCLDSDGSRNEFRPQSRPSAFAKFADTQEETQVEQQPPGWSDWIRSACESVLPQLSWF